MTLLRPRKVGDYLGAKGIDAIIFLSVVCSGAKVVVFRDFGPPPPIKIQNRDEILKAIENLAKRITK
jgi:hypothetical protein